MCTSLPDSVTVSVCMDDGVHNVAAYQLSETVKLHDRPVSIVCF